MAKSSIRAINQGTRYDITGNLRRLVRAIERGELGDVRHVIVGISANELDSCRAVTTFGFGTSSVPELAMTADLMKKRLTRGD